MGRRALQHKKVRLNLELSEEVRDNVAHLRDMTKADSMSEVIRRALGLYDFVVRNARNGGVLVARTDTEEREIVIL